MSERRRFVIILLALFACQVYLILADGNVSGSSAQNGYGTGNNGFSNAGGHHNGFGGVNGNGLNNGKDMPEEDTIAECTRCGDSRLIGCMRGKCYYRCYRRCILGNMTYQGLYSHSKNRIYSSTEKFYQLMNLFQSIIQRQYDSHYPAINV